MDFADLPLLKLLISPWIHHEQVVSLLGRADNTVRSAATAAHVTLYRHDDNVTIGRLVAMNAVKCHTRNLTLITLDGARRLCLRMAQNGSEGAEALSMEIQQIKRSSMGPPPLRHQPGFMEWHEPAPSSILLAAGFPVIQLPSMAPTQPPPEASMSHFHNDFPTAPPSLILLPEQMRAPYALAAVSQRTKAEINRFMEWSSAPINTERSPK